MAPVIGSGSGNETENEADNPSTTGTSPNNPPTQVVSSFSATSTSPGTVVAQSIGTFFSAGWNGVKSAVTRADQFAGQVNTLVWTGTWVHPSTASGTAVVSAVGDGLQTSAKVAANGTAHAVVSTVTAGMYQGPDILTVTQHDRELGYDQAVGLYQMGAEVLIGVGTGGATAALSKAGRAGKAVSYGLRALDTVQNGTNVVNGVNDIAQNGLTLQNALQVGGGLGGLAGNASAIRAGAGTRTSAAVNAATEDAQALCAGRPGGGGCFVADTPVATGWSHEPVIAAAEDVSAGDNDPNFGWIIAGLGFAAASVFIRDRVEKRRKRRRRVYFADGRFSDEPEDPIDANLCGPEPDLNTSGSDIPSGENADGFLFVLPESLADPNNSNDNQYSQESQTVPSDPTVRPVLQLSQSFRRSGRFAGAMKYVWCLPLFLGALCFWQAAPSAQHPVPGAAIASTRSAPRSAHPIGRKLVTSPIQEIRVGQRVLASNPELAGQDVPQLRIDPETTRLVVLHQIKPDGHELTMETLWSGEKLLAAALDSVLSGAANRPGLAPADSVSEDAALHDLLVGHVVDLNLPELGAEGPAEIVAVRPCPLIEPDDGIARRLVTSVFRHSAANVVHATFTGTDESISATATHPFWSEDRQAFVPAGQLREGERLHRADGMALHVSRVTPRGGPPVPVFNIEVDGEHVYSVGANGFLVHNVGCPLNVSRTVVSRPNIHHIASQYDKRLLGLFEEVGVDIQSAYNKVKIIGHQGPHGWYNDYIFRRLSTAVTGLSGKAARSALLNELLNLRWELKNTDLGDLLGAGSPGF